MQLYDTIENNSVLRLYCIAFVVVEEQILLH